MFEHLLEPKAILDEIVAVTSDRAILALDLDDKGPRVYQHVSPTLAPLKRHVVETGFAEFGRTGNVTLFRRRT